MAIVTAKNLTFSYAKSEYKALDDLSFEINSSDIVLLMGASGSGKTTLSRLMKKELAPNGNASGSMVIKTKKVGFVLQNMDESIVCDTVRSELAFGCRCQGLSDNEIELKIAEIASYFSISDYLDSSITTLSGGTKQLVALASVMMDSPELLILDEPTSSLDSASRERFLQLILRINKELGVTVIIATHAPSDFFSNADKVIMLDSGKMLFCLPPKDGARWLIESKNEMMLAMPLSARLFDSVPLTVSEARIYADTLKEKPYEEKISKRNDFAVEIKNIYFSYNKNSNDVLSSLSLKIERGSITGLIGSNGCGKTTLLSIIAGVLKQYRGKVKIGGKTSMMPQNVRLLFTKEKVSDEISDDTAKMLCISNILNNHPYDISGGQAHLVALGKVLETNADIIILDEPTSGLDAPTKEHLASILKGLCDDGKTVIIATHDIDFAGRYADNVCFLSSGKICALGDRRKVFSSLDFYTTEARRITKGYLSHVVSQEDLM